MRSAICESGQRGRRLTSGVWSQAIGKQYTPTNDIRAFIYTVGKMVDLNTLIDATSGIFLSNAVAINDQGEIVCQGTDSSGNFANYLLKPTE